MKEVAVEPKAQNEFIYFMLWSPNLTLLYIHFLSFYFVCKYSALYKVSRYRDTE